MSMGVDGADSELRLVAGFGISDVEPSKYYYNRI
jgi:hypothetical protein